MTEGGGSCETIDPIRQVWREQGILHWEHDKLLYSHTPNLLEVTSCEKVYAGRAVLVEYRQ
jgi:hypothetical protein